MGARKYGSNQHGHPKLPSAGITHEGSLTGVGYHEDSPPETRHESLRRAATKFGYAKTVEKVNALAVVNKGHPEKHARLEYDLAWLKWNYRNGPKPKVPASDRR